MHNCSWICRIRRETALLQSRILKNLHDRSCPSYIACSTECRNEIDKGANTDAHWHHKNCPNHTSACCMGDEPNHDLDDITTKVDEMLSNVIDLDDHYEIVRDGKPVAVIISYDEYQRMMSEVSR